ncbi:MAG: ABC transporter ATP-binding protein [Candidatus Zixiibacteriota bacterium]
MKIDVHKSCANFRSYRAARVKSLFNAESGANFDLVVELPIDDADWKLGLIVGPSGSGKSSLGEKVLGKQAFYQSTDWPDNKPIIDAIAASGDFNDVTAALASVGLGSVPTWLRPYRVLSNGEKFRADLARVIAERPDLIVIDEFTSVVDRQIARFGALAFAKSWKRGAGKCVLLSCHYDIIEWLEPDWVFDTGTGKYSGRGLWRRPSFELAVWQTDWRYWSLFEQHHYLKIPKMIGARCYVGSVDDEPVVHLAVATKNCGTGIEARACRLVVMPEWQGAGVGIRFLNHICQLQLEGLGRMPGRKLRTLFHTSHPGLCSALRRDKRWRQVSAHLFGASKAKSAASIQKSARKLNRIDAPASGYGGHFRAVQGFRYYGEAAQ